MVLTRVSPMVSPKNCTVFSMSEHTMAMWLSPPNLSPSGLGYPYLRRNAAMASSEALGTVTFLWAGASWCCSSEDGIGDFAPKLLCLRIR